MKRFKYLTLAALVAFAACDEGTETVVEPPVTGTISGVVTIEGVGASGVTVTLSSGQTTSTDGSGSYAFSGVSAGAYTVSISGFASDATFSSTSKAATITTAGQVVTVNFDGSYVRTSAILGSVAAGGSGLSGVTVSLSGGSSTTTDANGQYAFSGLRAGSYTVSISGFDASQYTFSTTSQSVSVGVGESKVVSFSGQLLTTAKIMGSLYIDENDNNNNFDEALEDKLAVANVAVTIEGGAVNDTMTVMTDANGDYMFE
ncbi:MAG: carboxypeptidase regulatory-like domain-containing protein, partial [Gemmatimonadota bacterium]